MKGFLDFLSKVCAVVTLLVIAFLFCYSAFNGTFVPANVMVILGYIQTYAVIGTLGLVAMEFGTSKGFLMTVLMAILVAAVVIISFFPAVAGDLTGFIKIK